MIWLSHPHSWMASYLSSTDGAFVITNGKIADIAHAYNYEKTVKNVLNRNTQTKYYDIGDENVQVYHNMGRSGGAILGAPYGDPTFFNPWSDIPPGTGRANRIGDKIRPLSMSITLWIANKLDRPNIMYRVMVLRMPKSIGAQLTNSSNVDLFQAPQLGANGNRMCLPLDQDRGIKAYYDRTFNLQTGLSGVLSGSITGFPKESHKLIKIHLRRKQSREIVFDSAEMHVFVVVFVFEVGHALLGLELAVALPVVVAGVGTGLAAGDEIGHGVQVRGLFRLVRRDTPVSAPASFASVAHGPVLEALAP
jgi:hypothetical protein